MEGAASDDPQTRQRRAIKAATAVATRHGVRVEEPVVLWDSNSTVVYLAPAPVVAKVATNPMRTDVVEALAHELAVGLHLARLGAPVAEPWPGIPAVLHRQDDLAMTFWRHYEQERDSNVPCRLSAPALREVHRCLETYPGVLPDWQGRVAGADLELPGSAPRLKERDRAFLLAEADRVRAEVGRGSFQVRPIHGSPHRYNLLDLGDHVLWIDLETACRGPLEWDVVHFGCRDEFPEADPRLLDLLSDLVSLNVAIACWLRMDAAPDLAWHAAHHLGRLRARSLRRRR